jgi:hypothetical protein
MSENPRWPDLPLTAWSDTCGTLQLWTQIVGKVRIALTPLVNHWWNSSFYVTGRGLAAPAMPFSEGMVDITFDFASHQLVIETSGGRSDSFALKPMPVCDFYSETMERLHRLGVDVQIRTMPCEIEHAVPFDRDRVHAQYDPVYVRRFWHALVEINRVMNVFRARFLGKASPVHFFWGSFDLAVTRFSGRTAPPPKGHTAYVADWIMAEAYSHECSSCGFWPGNGGFGYPAFYVYAYPEPAGYGETRLTTTDASYNTELGQFILPYDALRQARNPDALLLGFLQETYAPAADLAKWDRKALERNNQDARS